MKSPGARLPRFRRAVHDAPQFQITERDTEMLRQVARHRFLRSSHLIALSGGSRAPVLRRLQLLFHHGYLERPRCQLDYYHQGGSREFIHGLGSRGAAHLRRVLDLPFHRMVWSGKNQSVGRVFLEHALMVSDFMVALELSCRARTNVRLLTRDDIPLPARLKNSRDAFQWQVTVAGGTKIGVVPDAVFALEHLDATGKPHRVLYFVEADRGTMPVQRDGLARSSIQRKLLAYEATWKQELHQSRFGWNRFRVLTITSSADRLRHIRETCRQMQGGGGLFLFTEADSLGVEADVLAQTWRSFHEGLSTLVE